jgi:hypothetical protein
MDFTAVLHQKGRSVYLHNKLQLSPLSQFALKKSDDCRGEDHAIAWSGLSGAKARLNTKKTTTFFLSLESIPPKDYCKREKTEG